MTRPPGRARGIRLSDEAYRDLCAKILERDGWMCQHCGRREQLQIHHLIHRSQLGTDSEDNLIVLCAECHHQVHRTAYITHLGMRHR